MFTLYIDTHFVNLVLALFKDGKLINEKKIESNKHSENTINMLNEVLNDANISIDNLNEIIVINGPGSFTGVRIGIVIAKIIGFTKNVSIKTLSYLEAMALNYDFNVIVGIKDKNGVFVGEFDGTHKLQNDYYYLNNKEFESFNNIILDGEIDLLKVYEYAQTKDNVNPHSLIPLYVKRIEVEK